MYFVDRQKIENTLKFLEAKIETYLRGEDWQSQLGTLALERIVHMMIDSVLDVGNLMIDGFIMRDPGSYEDIVDILLDEKVIDSELAASFKAFIPLRKKLVQDYTEVDREELLQAVQSHVSSFQKYSEAIRTYLNNELGPVSAFKAE
ncbi:DUF86 domain-containing protein [Peribacillus alkalitolerans]|uniref:DUF86 domain-containing protein n=1 Tax=Peribacillus alkalitolerans TaxID=1550385 RepID=UPI0013D58240|nr:DUF86 domain-containing protein [Peribacillus alkalitolerans]